jgi:hypothetical protein
MDAISYHPARHRDDTDDIAYEFIEQEVGRFDWRNNWPKFKANYATPKELERRVQAWLDYCGIDYDPKEIINFLDDMVTNRNGRWR